MDSRELPIGQERPRRSAGAGISMLNWGQCTLAWRVLALGITGPLGAQCGVEAKVSIERIGTQGTSAEDRLGPSELNLAVALSLRRSCWAAGKHYLTAGPGPRGSNRLLSSSKKIDWGGRKWNHVKTCQLGTPEAELLCGSADGCASRVASPGARYNRAAWRAMRR